MSKDIAQNKKDKALLRRGVTTGSCAAAAAKAAVVLLLSGEAPKNIRIMTPKGVILILEIVRSGYCSSWAYCAVQKDSGDDPDVTNGAYIYAWVCKQKAGITIDGGKGVGRVTKKGLDQPVGAAAINRVPRQMILENALDVCRKWNYEEGLHIMITVPKGEMLAKKTLNGKLGIQGGISILGTSGIVEPMSEKSLFDSIAVELKAHYANGMEYLIMSPGNYGQAFLEEQLHLPLENAVKVSNFVGDSLCLAQKIGYKEVLLVGHLGKLIKLAGGIMQTHSQYADCRMEILGVHSAMVGVPSEKIKEIMDSVTTEQALEVLMETGLMKEALGSILTAIEKRLEFITEEGMKIHVLLFSEKKGLLAQTEDADSMIAYFRQREQDT